ncbi:T3SS effector NleG family protein, partial [Escherichia coli]|nr:T3SS effector NleG family protein [Escherichia coli]
SREAFSPEMIVGREECYFDLTDQRFCIISGQDVRF